MISAIGSRELRNQLDSDAQIGVIDVREPQDFVDGHIPESTPVPRRKLEFSLPKVVPNREAVVVLCDDMGERAPLDAEWLSFLGYEDVRYLAGGMDAWVDEGLEIIEAIDTVPATGSNVPSKDFGEKIQALEDIPQLTPEELDERLRTDGEDILVTDVRTPTEHSSATIPGSINVEGVDLARYIDILREDPDQPVVVHCAGRTRSIIGTATLRRLGFTNVYELENGTMGWKLAGYELEEGAERHVTEMDKNDEYAEEIRDSAFDLLDEHDIPRLSHEEFRAVQTDKDETVYAIDVRTSDEYEAGHVPGTISIPGGQAIQTADEHIAVRNGTIVLISDQHVRASIVAFWFAEMGFPNVTILDEGVTGWMENGRELVEGPDRNEPVGMDAVRGIVEMIDPTTLSTLDATVIDIDYSENYSHQHVPGAKWVSRYDLERTIEGNRTFVDGPLVLTCQHGEYAMYAAAAIEHELDHDEVYALDGGVEAWTNAGLSTESGTREMRFTPRDVVEAPYEQGRNAMRSYLEWEEELGEKYT